ncbi:MAG: head-tail joining protein, partial [Aquidulcibacter sp.]
MASLIADPHLGCAAQYRQGGIGAPVSLRVLRSSPDRMADAFGT